MEDVGIHFVTVRQHRANCLVLNSVLTVFCFFFFFNFEQLSFNQLSASHLAQESG